MKKNTSTEKNADKFIKKNGPSSWSVRVNAFTLFCSLTENIWPRITQHMHKDLIPLKTLNLCSLYSKIFNDFVILNAEITLNFFLDIFSNIVENNTKSPIKLIKTIAK